MQNDHGPFAGIEEKGIVNDLPVNRKLSYTSGYLNLKRAQTNVFDMQTPRRQISTFATSPKRCDSSYLRKHSYNQSNIKVVARIRPQNKMEEVFIIRLIKHRLCLIIR